MGVFIYYYVYREAEDAPVWAALALIPVFWIVRWGGLIVGFTGAVAGIFLVDSAYYHILGEEPSDRAEQLAAWVTAALFLFAYTLVKYSRRVPAEEYTFKPDY